MSIGFMLPNADDPVIWRGPRKNGALLLAATWATVPLAHW
jgi:hypothetical protein